MPISLSLLSWRLTITTVAQSFTARARTERLSAWVVSIDGVAPSNPLVGHWWLRSTDKLHVYTGTEWAGVGSDDTAAPTITVVAGDGISITLSGTEYTVSVDLAMTPMA